jgi:hypothetical protein
MQDRGNEKELGREGIDTKFSDLNGTTYEEHVFGVDFGSFHNSGDRKIKLR